MLEKALENIAEKILNLDEASLSTLWEKYRQRMESFDTSREWEKAVIIFFIINAVRVKNHIFNDQVTQNQGGKKEPGKTLSATKDIPYLKRIK